MPVTEREKEFYDEFWKQTKLHTIDGKMMEIPKVDSLVKKRVLICSCGAGWLPVQAANEGAEVYTFDISTKAVENAINMANYNKVKINAEVMDFHSLKYPENYFDVICGTMILHHVDCSIVSKEIYRCLKPNGIGYFKENSDRNPILRFFRKSFFGKPGEFQKQKFFIFKRGGSIDEYPLTDKEIENFRNIFGKQNVKILFQDFVFYQCLYRFGPKIRIVKTITEFLDICLINIFPFLKKYSFLQNVWMEKKIQH